MSKIFDKTIDGLAQAIHMRKLKQDLISSNLANAETPGYKAKVFEFEEALARQLDLDNLRQLSTNHSDHIAVGGGQGSIRPQIYDDPNGVTSPDGNTVDLEKEMTRLSENQIQFKAAIQLINKK